MSVVCYFLTQKDADLPYPLIGRISGQRIHLWQFLQGDHFSESKTFSAWFALLKKQTAQNANEPTYVEMDCKGNYAAYDKLYLPLLIDKTSYTGQYMPHILLLCCN